MILWQKISLDYYNGPSGFKIYDPDENAITERNFMWNQWILKLFIIQTRYPKTDIFMHFYPQRLLTQCI